MLGVPRIQLQPLLFFLCREATVSMSHDALVSSGPFSFLRTLDDAAAECRATGHADARVLVVDPTRVNLVLEEPPSSLRLAPAAVLNLGSTGYLPPEAIAAAGGYVVRRTPAGVELLLIHRRGAWDLPKGKLDAGESPAAGAQREVAEEVGVPEESLEMLRPLGTTTHGYPHPKRPTYAVKTTHWYAFRTSAERFVPQASEDIEAAEWVPWSEAGARLDFEKLRHHHASLDPDSLGI